MPDLLQNRYLLTVTSYRKLDPEGVELVIEIHAKSPTGTNPLRDSGAVATSGKTSPGVSDE